jgi:hypothetical protein
MLSSRPQVMWRQMMNTTTETTATRITAQRDALGERLFAGLLGGMELLAVQLGIKLGLYGVLRDTGVTTSSALAQRAGIDERYAREWLEQQAVAGILEIAESSEDPAKRGYALPAGHAEALLDPESPGYAAAIPPGLLGLAKVLDALPAAYRTGEGSPTNGTERRSAKASAASTGRCSLMISLPSGSLRCPTCTNGWWAAKRCGCWTSRAVPVGRRSRWLARTRT